jgi:RNA polymerase sigma-70 factor (ECF subfamily)
VHEAHFYAAYPAARRAAQVYGAAAVVASALPATNRSDFEQEALLGVWRALPHFDPTRASLRTFAERVVANQIASTARAQRAVRRTPVPTDAPVYSEHPGSTIELRLDVERALAVLRDGDRQLARLLAHNSPTEASRIARLSRSTVYEAIGRIRLTFLRAGLGPCSAGGRIQKRRGRVTPDRGSPDSGVRDKLSTVAEALHSEQIGTGPNLLREVA